jgi:FkbM family methyltransferase
MSSYPTEYLKKHLPKNLFYRLRLQRHRLRRSVSQFGQDFWVMGEVFNEKENGFFLDVGSAGGVIINNTLLLEKRYHWRGICIEANPEGYQELTLVRKARCINCCVDNEEGEVQFLKKGLFSGIVDNSTDLRDEAADGSRTIQLKTRPLKAILDEHQAPKTIDYLSIDVEGAEERILGSFPFSDYRFSCMTIERPKPILRDVLQKNGYILIKEIPGYDCFYLHESFLPQYQKNLFDFWAKYRF